MEKELCETHGSKTNDARRQKTPGTEGNKVTNSVLNSKDN